MFAVAAKGEGGGGGDKILLPDVECGGFHYVLLRGAYLDLRQC